MAITRKNTSYQVRPDKHTTEAINELNPEEGVIVFDDHIKVLKVGKGDSFEEIHSDPKRIGKKLIGWQDFADSNTSEANPLIQSAINGGEVQLTNNNNDTATDGNTNVNAETTVEGLNDLWNTSTNTFDFKDTGIEKNDLFDIRVHLNISADIIAQDFSVKLEFYNQIGGLGGSVFALSEHVSTETLSAGVFRERIVNMDGYFGESILEGSAKLFLVGTKSFKVEVVGWKINIFKIAR